MDERLVVDSPVGDFELLFCHVISLQDHECGELILTKAKSLIYSTKPLVVIRIVWLSRSLRDLQNLAHAHESQNIKIMATEQAIYTSSASGKAFLDMPGVFAEFKTRLHQERQWMGIAKAKKKGRKPTACAKISESPQ